MSAAMLLNLKENLDCPICMDIFTVPKLLSCGHTFCQECIGNHIRESMHCHSFKCPICQAVHDRNITLTDNWILVDVVDKISELQSTSDMYSCSSCVSESAYLCENCCELLCVACHIRHTERGDYLSHQIVILSMDEEEKYQQINKMEYSLCQKHNGVFKKQYCTVCNMTICKKCVTSLDHLGHREHIVSLHQRKDELMKKCEDDLQRHRTKFEDKLQVLDDKSLQLQRKKDCLLAQWKENMRNTKTKIQEYVQEKENMVCPAQDLIQSKLLKNDRLKTELQSLGKSQIKYAMQCLQELDVKIVALDSEEIDVDIMDIAETTDIEKEFIGSYLFCGKCEHGTSTDDDGDCQEESIKVVNDVNDILASTMVLNALFQMPCLLYVLGYKTEEGSLLIHVFISLWLLMCQTATSMFSLHIFGRLKHIDWRLKFKTFLGYGICLMFFGMMNFAVVVQYFQKSS